MELLAFILAQIQIQLTPGLKFRGLLNGVLVIKLYDRKSRAS